MDGFSEKRLDIVAAIGLALGGIFGIAGTMVSAASLRQTFWGIDGVALVAATALLAGNAAGLVSIDIELL